MKVYLKLIIGSILISQTQAIWPFDSSGSSTSSDSSPSETSSSGGLLPFDLFGSGSSSSQSSSPQTSSTKSSSDSASSTDSSLLTGNTSGSSWYQSFLDGDSGDQKTDYAPYNLTCPSKKSFIRTASELSQQEKDYIHKRQETTNKNLIDFLSTRANLSDFDAKSFVNDNAANHNITIGLSFSGGGYRAMLAGAGQMLGLDGRYEDANKHGLGGLLDSSTYVVGLSGGNWLVGSLALNDWLSVGDIVNGKSTIWQLQDSILNPSGMRIDKTIAYYYGLAQAIQAKEDAGFQTSVTDTWGRALSYQFFEEDDSGTGGANITWSSIRNLSSFQDHSMPYPIVVANGRTPGTYIINENSTIFEISPYELGSWDPSLKSFTDIQYLGSSVNNGDPNNTDICVNNFDNAGFIMGTSSSLFNQILLQLDNYSINSVIKMILEKVLTDVSDEEYDIAVYEPNPFFGADSAGIKSITTNDTLYLCDGGEDLQNVPFYPLIQNERSVDVIFAFDNSADTNSSWPNGTSIQETYKRQFSKQGKGTPFPFAPDHKTFLDKNMGDKPVFFGCNSSDLEDLVAWHENDKINATDVPLIVYTSNTRMSYNSNFSTFKLSYSDQEKFGAIRNGFETVTRNNLTDDQNWSTCVGCAIIRRQQERLGEEQSDECKKCFQEYCWTGGFKDAASVSSVSGISGLATKTHTSGSASSTTQHTSTTTGYSSNGESSSSSSTSTSSKKKNGGDSVNGGVPSSIFLIFNSLLGLVIAYL
ncbi:lysophospholipase precursor, putative [Candida dubliniensis CD36]|uniref:Lysophospholipase n=1 Tax=Candida dubliniensis (strain CD36 / ATCC MYA-646 / CBS 7987 / NCPF 3949 / NRRL Y-17841) TaxID=573826 RepID=B9W8K3_CANDC|nr:lysophospholipase precursor, putative [Candida dubliniensis CD36]CAX45075.1 lysophospholipase precursor, putative [Candida dubliniensis CD36]